MLHSAQGSHLEGCRGHRCTLSCKGPVYVAFGPGKPPGGVQRPSLHFKLQRVGLCCIRPGSMGSAAAIYCFSGATALGQNFGAGRAVLVEKARPVASIISRADKQASVVPQRTRIRHHGHAFEVKTVNLDGLAKAVDRCTLLLQTHAVAHRHGEGARCFYAAGAEPHSRQVLLQAWGQSCKRLCGRPRRFFSLC